MPLSNSLNWNLGIRMSARGRKDSNNRYSFNRIRFSVPATNSIIVATGCRESKKTWNFGGTARIILPGTPSSTSQFTGGIVLVTQRLQLGKLTLINLFDYPKSIYSIEIDPPFWFPSIAYESWWYDDGSPTMTTQKLLEIQNTLTIINNKLD
jgi:hypothetical protein